ncbi:MAG: AAA family ATPase [Lachnospiraceae bacterium]|nr:AAA family ATPase [Lachnospiraceae bacterium]
MSVLKIKNFGPISNLTINVDRNINIIIGPQASGKSTIGKVFFFCKKIRDYYVDFILQDSLFLQTHPNELYINFLKYIRRNFMGCFGTTTHMPPFEIVYSFQSSQSVIISLKERYAFFEFSSGIEKEIRASLIDAHKIYKENQSQTNMSFVASFNNKLNLKNEIKVHFTELANKIFGSDEDIIYIPAGRSLLSVLSDQLDVIDISTLDLSMKEFMERIRITRTRFGTKLDSVVRDYLKTVQGQIKNTDIDIAKELIKYVLKAEYVNDTDGEKLYFDDTHWVKLIYGSSGQQESLWILLLLFIIILEKRKAYVVLEEPEAHLYPEAQRHMVEFIALTMNSSNSKFLVTTHSPYILSSANLLIQSAIVENQAALRTEEMIIKKQLRISPQRISAYKINEKEGDDILKSIIDEPSGLIESIEIDSISEKINEEAEKLDMLEIKYDL